MDFGTKGATVGEDSHVLSRSLRFIFLMPYIQKITCLCGGQGHNDDSTPCTMPRFVEGLQENRKSVVERNENHLLRSTFAPKVLKKPQALFEAVTAYLPIKGINSSKQFCPT